MYVELNIDALVGPSHHFGGVGVGNVASQAHTHQASYPRLGALEGLRKARLVADLGVPQYVMPPLRRPLEGFLKSLGFEGDWQTQCAQARERAPAAYSAAFSSAFMWAANAATVAPACDCADHQPHITLANLSSSWHRYFEHMERRAQLQQLFSGLPVAIHEALPPLVSLRDEGAANHMRLCNASGDTGFHVFVYGESEQSTGPKRHLARQTLWACQAIARLHRLDPRRTFFLQQHPDAIDAGVFHNDVIATSHRNLLIMHERAFINADAELERLTTEFQRVTGEQLQRIVVREDQLSLAEAVQCYLFNSQLLSTPNNSRSLVMICAAQCGQLPAAHRLIQLWIAADDNPISDMRTVSLAQSMSGGGGPACLRLRMSLPAEAVESFAPAYRLTPKLFTRLEKLINDHYPERLEWETLAQPENMSRYENAYAAFADVFAR